MLLPPRMTATFRLLMTADAVGGIWTYALDLGRALGRRGVDVTLAVVGPGPSREARSAAEAAGLAVVDLGHRPEWLAAEASEVEAAGTALADLAMRLGSDVVQVNHPALAARASFAQPVLAVCHSCVATWWAAVRGGELPGSFQWQAELVGDGYRAADCLVAPTQAFAQATQQAYGLSQAALAVPNGRMLPAEPGPQARSRMALTAGRLWDEGKGAATVDRAAALTAVPCLAAGPLRGPNGATIAFEHLRALGSLPDAALRRLMAEASVFVSAALYEPFGLAVLEAAQAGCALVLSDIPTLRELWDGAAVFVPPRDAAGFARAIEALNADSLECKRLGEAARARAARYTLEAQAERMHGLLAGLAGGNNARVAAA